MFVGVPAEPEGAALPSFDSCDAITRCGGYPCSLNAETIAAMCEAIRIDVDVARWPARNERGAERVGRRLLRARRGLSAWAAPPSDTNGNICRAVQVPDTSEFARDGALEEGVDLLTDAFGRWGPARTVWNQDAYQVTNVGDEGTIPRTRDVMLPTSFRSNVASTAARRSSCRSARASRGRRVRWGHTARARRRGLKRGTRSASAGQQVRFEDVDGERLCEGATLDVVAPRDCVAVRCELADSAVSSASVVAIVNPEQRTPECGRAEENVSAPAALGCE